MRVVMLDTAAAESSCGFGEIYFHKGTRWPSRQRSSEIFTRISCPIIAVIQVIVILYRHRVDRHLNVALRLPQRRARSSRA